MSGWSPEAQALMRWKAEREAGERCTGRDDCTAPLHVHGCLADRGACTAPAEHATEPTVQVRAVADLLDRYDNGDGECEPEDRWRLFRDMRALLSQPTPTAEHVKDWTDAQDNEGPGCSCGFNGSFEECAAWRAENPDPPIIADMVPGTTFWARTQNGVLSSTDRMWFVDAAGYVFSVGAHHIDGQRIDPSTIRDVTTPDGA